MKKYPNVVINGIKYVPVENVVLNYWGIVAMLLSEFWGVVTPERAKEYMKEDGYYIYVNEEGKGIPLKEFLDKNVADALRD